MGYISGRENHRSAYSKKFRELRGQTIVVKRSGLAGLDQRIRKGQQQGQFSLGKKTEIEGKGPPVEGVFVCERGGMKSGTDQPSRGASLVEQTNSDYELISVSLAKVVLPVKTIIFSSSLRPNLWRRSARDGCG